jgi:hypothetical protein
VEKLCNHKVGQLHLLPKQSCTPSQYVPLNDGFGYQDNSQRHQEVGVKQRREGRQEYNEEKTVQRNKSGERA